MAEVPYLVPDSLETLEMKEVNGVIRSLTRKVTIKGLTSTDYQVLLAAYRFVGLPNPGSFLASPPFTVPANGGGGITAPLDQLVLAGRDFNVHSNKDKDTVDVLLYYQHFMDGDNQNIGGNTVSPNGWTNQQNIVVYGKNRASVQQTKSNFEWTRKEADAWVANVIYLPGDVVDYKGIFWAAVVEINPATHPTWAASPPPGPAGLPPIGVTLGEVWTVANEAQLPDTLPVPVRRQIALAHQFPGAGTPAPDPNVPGQTIYQTGEITIMQPNDNFKLHGQVFIRNPRVIKKALLRAINSVPWMDGDSYEWMCTEVSWETLFANYQYRISMEFQRNEDTWLPTAIFNDARSGRPPSNLIPGLGYREVHYHPEVDLEAYFMRVFGCAPSAGS